MKSKIHELFSLFNKGMSKTISVFLLSAFLFSCSGNVQTNTDAVQENNSAALQKKLDAAIAAFSQSVTQLCGCGIDTIKKDCAALKAAAELNRKLLDSVHADYDLTYEFGTDKGNTYYNKIDSLNTAYTNCK